jgi:hypothetical protein
VTEPLVLLAPLLLLLIFVWFGFTGCVGSDPDISSDPPPAPPATPPAPGGTAPAPPSTGGGPAPAAYETLVKSTPGFTSLWRLNESGGNVARDSGPLSPATDGRYSAGGVTLGQAGALQHKDPADFAPALDGASGYVEVAYDARFNPAAALAFSVELWARPTPGGGAATQVLVSSHFIDPTKDRGYEIALLRVAGQTQPTIRGRLFTSSGAPDEITVVATQGAADAWRHIVMTYDGAGKKLNLYVGIAGVAAAFIAPPMTGVSYQPNGSATLRFGAGHRQAPGPVNFYAGQIDEVAFYAAALTPAQIAAHFAAF